MECNDFKFRNISAKSQVTAQQTCTAVGARSRVVGTRNIVLSSTSIVQVLNSIRS